MVDERLKHGALTQKVIGTFFEVYNELGHGFIESVYQKSFAFALTCKGLLVNLEIEIPVWFRGQKVGDFSADMLVEKSVLIELKACRMLDSAHEAQLLNYLRATQIEVGLLFNFGLKAQFRRFAFDNRRKAKVERSQSLIEQLLVRDE